MIQPGQTYRSASPAKDGTEPRHRRIRIVGPPMSIPGVYGFGTIMIATLTENGDEVRPRHIPMKQLHTTATTRDGAPRRTGYILEDT